MQTNSTPWVVFLFGSFPTVYLYLWYGLVKTPSKLLPFGNNWNWVISFFQQISEFALLACLQFWIDRFFAVFARFPSYFVKIFFYGIYLSIFILNFVNYASAYNEMQFLTPAHFRSLFAKSSSTKSFTPPLNIHPKFEPLSQNFVGMIENLILQNKQFFAVSIILFCGWVAIQVKYLFNRITKIIVEISKTETKIAKYPAKFLSYSYNDFDAINDLKFDRTAKLFHCIAGLAVLTHFLILTVPSFSGLTRYSTLTYIQAAHLSLRHFEKHHPKVENLKNNSRTYLPPGRYWLDSRSDPVFPAVHSGINAFCAYNKFSQECRNFVPTPQIPVTKLPNVVLLLLENLTPTYNLISKEFIEEHVTENTTKRLVSSMPFFNPVNLPNIAKYQKLGISFSGMSSLGSPSDSGWHALMTGIPPSQTFSNLHDGFYLHSDDLPSFLHSGGYRTLYFSGKPIDGTDDKNWVWRRNAREEAIHRLNCNNLTHNAGDDIIYLRHSLRHCREREIDTVADAIIEENKDFPTWYDRTYKISTDNINDIDLPEDEKPEGIRDIYPDRIVAEQLISKWKVNREITKGPIFAAFQGVETSRPYDGFDSQDYYAPVNETLSEDEIREQRYMNMVEYADKYQIGRVLDWLKRHDNNTIFIITGKSGARDVPIQKGNYSYGNGVVYSTDCAHGSSGTDSFFTTGAVIGYLGDDEAIKKIMRLNNHAGQTLKIPTDHNDLVYTIEDILSKINGTEVPPTHRRSRNLIDLTHEIFDFNAIKKINSSGWRSYSMTTYLADYREGPMLIKSHTNHPEGAHFYNAASFPTCLKRSADEPMQLGGDQARNMYSRMMQFIKTENYLTSSNRLYHYWFRDAACIERGRCEFPTPTEITISDEYFIGIILVLPLLLVGIVSIVLNVLVVLAPLFNIGKSTSISKRRQSFYEI